MALECTHLLSPKHNRRGRSFSGRACRAARGPYGEFSKASLGSLSNSVFERRTSTGSGLFASLGSGLVETLG